MEQRLYQKDIVVRIAPMQVGYNNLNTNDMKIQDTTEYVMVKQLTSKENRVAVKRTIFQGLMLSAVCYVSFYLFLNAFLWVLKY